MDIFLSGLHTYIYPAIILLSITDLNIWEILIDKFIFRRRFATEPEVKKHIDNHMNPHAAKTRRDSTGSEGKLPGPGMLPRGLTPTTVVKPELYFPQCYAPSFNPPSSVAQFSAPPPEFKPANPLPAQWLTASWQLGPCIGWPVVSCRTPLDLVALWTFPVSLSSIYWWFFRRNISKIFSAEWWSHGAVRTRSLRNDLFGHMLLGHPLDSRTILGQFSIL